MAEEATSKDIQSTTTAHDEDDVQKQQEPLKKEEVEDGDVNQKKEDEECVSEDSLLGSDRTVSFREDSNLLSDLKDVEKKALLDLRSKLEDAIINNKLFVFHGEKKDLPEDQSQKTRSHDKADKEEENEKEKTQGEGREEKEKSMADDDDGQNQEKKTDESTAEAKQDNPEDLNFAEEIKEAKEKLGLAEETKDATVQKEDAEEEEGIKQVTEEKLEQVEVEKEAADHDHDSDKNKDEIEETATVFIEVDNDIKLWGVYLLPSKGDKGTDVILLKFLRAREFKAQEAFEMLRNALKWRKENNIDSILEEEFPPELSSVAYMEGMDKHGHPICYNIFGTFLQDDIHSKIFGTEEMRHKFLRWRFQLMERGIKKLDFSGGGVASMLQVNDLRNSPGPTKKELRMAMKQAVALLQDNYPEFVARNIFINVPFWSYAFYAVVSPFFTQRTKSKFDFARPAKVTETLLKYIAPQQIPVAYGGFHRVDDSDFSIEDSVTEVNIKGGSTESIEILAPEAGTTLIWEITVLGWDVSYKEEFVPTDEGSYTMIVQKVRKVTWQEGPLRNSFKNKEAGKLVLTIDNAAFKKKRVLYRYKSNLNPTSAPSSSST